MATLISASAGGNWTTLATWRNVCSGSGAALTTLTAVEAKTNPTYTYGVAFTVTNAEVIEGFALHLQRSGVTGTLTVALSDDGGTTATREVVVNLSDLPANYSWVFFKFGSTLTADGGADYKAGIKLSSGASGVSIYRGSATAGDWSHILREDSAPGSLSAGDVFYIVDDLTGAGAKTANTVTMDCLASAITDFGEINVGFGTLNCGVAAATNYYLKASGNCNVWGGGYFNVGSVGTPLPQDSTAIFELDPTSDGEFGFIFKDGSVVTVQGYPMTKVWTLLNANASANDTSLTTADSTGWKDNDQIVVASTSRTATETEAGTLNGNASGTTLTVDGFAGTGGGVAYAHDGSATGGPNNADIRAEIINLTRNVKFRSATSTIMAYIYVAAIATVDFDYVEMYYLGENVATKRGLEIATTTGSCSIQYCSFHDCEDFGVYVSTTTGSIGFVFNVCHKLNTAQAASQFGAYFTGTSGAHTITDNVFLNLQSSNQRAVEMLDSGSTFSRNRIAGSQGTATVALALIGGIGELGGGACDDNILHSNVGIGVQFVYAPLNPTVYSNWGSWRNGSYGITISPQSVGYISFANTKIFGNTTANLLMNGSSIAILDSCDIQSDAAYTTAQGIYNTNSSLRLICKDCVIGTAVPHVSYGINVLGLQVYLHNTTIGDSVEVNTSSLTPLGFVRSYKHDASGTTHKSWYRYGTVASDQSVRHTASGYAWKMNPIYYIYGAFKLVFPGPGTFDPFKAAVVASAAVTVTAWVRKDATYNGNAPRLVLVGGYLGGIAADVTDSLSVGADTWEQLSVSGTPNEAGVVEWYVDCDGTAGSVYVDDMAVSQSGLPSADNLDYVSWGLPITSPYTLGTAAAGGLLTHPGMAGGMRG